MCQPLHHTSCDEIHTCKHLIKGNIHNHKALTWVCQIQCSFFCGKDRAAVGSIIIMPYKSTSSINSQPIRPSLLRLAILLTLMSLSSAQSDCAKKPFPANISLRTNQSIIINLDDYFDGSNLTFKVSPNNSFSSVQPTYQCSAVGAQAMGKVIASRYFLWQGVETIAALTNSQFVEGAFSFYLYQPTRSKPTVINLPKQDIADCSHFDVRIINNTHFSPTIDCNYTAKNYTRVLLNAVGQLDSPYADWTVIMAPLFVKQEAVVRVELADGVLLRGVFTATNSYFQVWLWSEEEMQIAGILDKTFLGISSFNIKAMKVYANLVIVLDYQSGLHLFRILPTKTIAILGFIANPFFQEFQYNPITGLLYLAKKGKIVSFLLNPYTLSLALTGDSYNIYKYEHIRKILITDSTIVALGETAVNIFRKIGASSDTRHYSLYQINNPQTIYSRLAADGFTILLIQNPGVNLAISSCRVKAPFLKLTTPIGSIPTTVTATSVLDRQQSTCIQRFTFQFDISSIDQIYDNGYEVDNEVVFANQQGEGVIELSKYGVGKNIAYELKPIATTILQNDTKIKKSLPVNCSFNGKPIVAGGKVAFLHSWQNIVIVQFSIDMSLRYYICGPKSCEYSIDYFRMLQVQHISHETIDSGKDKLEVLEALLQEDQTSIEVLVRRLVVSNQKLSISAMCSISFNVTSGEKWNITQLQIYNSYLYLVMPYRKEVRIYDLRQDQCPNVLNLNTATCPWGYFAPQSIHFNRARGNFPSETFIIKQWDELLTVRLQRRQQLRPVLVIRNMLPLVVNYTLIFTHPYLVAFDMMNNHAYTFYFDDANIIQYLREIPLDQHRFQQASSSFAKLLDPRNLALHLQDQLTNIKYTSVYKIDQLISGAMQYISYTIKPEETAIWLSIQNVWYLFRVNLINNNTLANLTCKANSTYLNPTAQLFFGRTPSASEEYSENVVLTLHTADKSKLHEFKITLSNVGDSIKRGTNFPNRGDSIQARQMMVFNDRRWFSGSIFYYEFQCQDCGDRITFKQKVTLEDSEPLPVPPNKFWLERGGKVVKVLMGNSLVELEYNYTVWPIAEETSNATFGVIQTTLLTTTGGNCLQAVPARRQSQIIALCERVYEDQSKAFYLSLVSTASYKTFVVAESLLNFQTDSQPKLIVKNDIIVIYTSEVAYLMALWEVQERLQFIQLDQIDHQDIQSKICSIDLTFNNTIQASPITEILFSMIVTECTSNIYLTSFIIYLQRQQYRDEQGNLKVTQIPNLHVNSAQNINLIAKFGQSHIQIPSQATVVQTLASRSSTAKDQLSVLAVFDKFHTYEFILYLSQSGVAFNITINRVFYKYGNYQAISAEKGAFLAVKYKSKLLGREERYGFFDMAMPVDEGKPMKEYYTFSGYSLQNSAQSGLEIPWIYDDHTIVQFNGDFIETLNITNILRGYIKRIDENGHTDANDILYTQKIQITANNIASARSAVILLKAVDRIVLEGWQILLIVVGGLAFLIGGFFGLRWSVRKIREKRKMVPLVRDSLLEDADLQFQEQQRMSSKLNASRVSHQN